MMASLHLVNRSPGESMNLLQCLERAGEGDAVLLLESGVYAAISGSALAARLAEALGKVRVFALAEDMSARGIADAELMAGIERVDYRGFVELSLAHSPIVSWS